jgi:hypothetical protein
MDDSVILGELQEIKDDIKMIKTAIFIGNGKPPLLQRVADVEKISNGICRVVWIIVGVILTTATGVVATQIAIHWPK